MRWLFIEPGRIGDWLCATVAVRQLLKESDSFDWVVRKEVSSLLSRFLPFDNAYYLPTSIDIWSLIKFLNSFSRERYDRMCVLSPARSAWFIAKFLRSKRKIGYLDYPTYYMNNEIKVHNVSNCSSRYSCLNDHIVVRALKSVGLDNSIDYAMLKSNEAFHPRLILTTQDINSAKNILNIITSNDRKPLIVLHPGTRWICKEWSTEKWIQLGKILSERAYKIIIGAGPDGIAQAKQIANKIGRGAFSLPEAVSLPIYAAMIHEAKLLVAPDSASMHIAAAVGTPVVALFGPSNPNLSGPICTNQKVFIATSQINQSCCPCNFPTENVSNRSCLIESNLCMDTLGSETVLKAIDSLINN
jgi:ADP-heptose:LPS heptosyltransferase